METKKNKILRNEHTKYIDMFAPTTQMKEYYTFNS
jgi:hypothetical protein